jgi:hypothetical protein
MVGTRNGDNVIDKETVLELIRLSELKAASEMKRKVKELVKEELSKYKDSLKKDVRDALLKPGEGQDESELVKLVSDSVKRQMEAEMDGKIQEKVNNTTQKLCDAELQKKVLVQDLRKEREDRGGYDSLEMLENDATHLMEMMKG